MVEDVQPYSPDEMYGEDGPDRLLIPTSGEDGAAVLHMLGASGNKHQQMHGR